MPRKRIEPNLLSGERVKELLRERKDAGKKASQEWLAEQLDISSVYLSDIVRGKKRLTPEMAIKIIRLFPSVRMEWLLGVDNFKTHEERIEKTLDIAFNQAKCLDTLMQQLADAHGCKFVISTDESTGEEVYAIVENDLVIALLSFDDYLNTRREIAHYSTYLFENLLAKQKRMLLKPYPLKQEEQDNG